MSNNLEKRRYKRLPIKMTIEVSNLFKQDNIILDIKNTELEVCNVSKSGIGFMTTTNLPLGYYFNATLEFGDSDNKLLTVVKIVRGEDIGEHGYIYGCEIIGLPPILEYLFDQYEEDL